jgi:hypothetical protein
MLEDHAVGLELQIIELVEQETRARVQGRLDDAKAVRAQIATLQSELADIAEAAVTEVEAASMHGAETAVRRASAA